MVIPAFNEQDRLVPTLDALLSMPAWGDDCEVLVVDDGSADGTVEMARKRLANVPLARVLRLPWHAGKGAAVRFGVAAATGQKVLFMDADLATDLEVFEVAIEALDVADVVVGSRVVAGAVVTGRGAGRRALHRGFSAHARRFGRIEVSDPQCGFKCFRADAAKLLFGLSHVDGYAFDVEILHLAAKAGMRIAEIPVTWQDVEGSKVQPVRDVIVMATDVARMRLRHSRYGGVAEQLD